MLKKEKKGSYRIQQIEEGISNLNYKIKNLQEKK